jgi:hypothetical protein
MEKIDDQANDKINQSLQICSINKTKLQSAYIRMITNKLEDLQKILFIFFIFIHMFFIPMSHKILD